jgi:predicted dehydrogenase
MIGLGCMGRRHARALHALEARYEIVGGYDLQPEARAPEGVERLASGEDAIERADVVVVATPIGAHARIGMQALAAGKHVLVEKPLAATTAEANALVSAARGAGRVFVGHSERFNPVVRALARLVRAEDVAMLDLRRVGPCRPDAGGALANLAVHDFDLAAYLGGGEIALRGATGSRAHGAAGEDFAHAVFSTARGGAGHLYVDRTALVQQRSILLLSADWVYEGDLLHHCLTRRARDSSVSADVPLPLEEPLLAQACALADALDGRGTREIATGVDGARAVELAERAASFIRETAVERASTLRGLRV